MITESDMYWITRLDPILEVVKGVGVAGLMFGSIVGAISACIYYDNTTSKAASARAKIWAWIGLLVLFIGIAALVGRAFIPTTREYCAIKVVPMLAQNEDLKGLGGDIVGLAREWVKELRPKSAEKIPERKEP